MTAAKKILFILILLVAVSIIFTQSINVVFGAIGTTINPGEYLDPLGKGATNIRDAGGVVNILIIILRWTYTIFFVISAFMVILAAFTYLTAGADPEQIKSANHKIIYAAIAVAVALLAVSINAIVGSIVGTSGGGTGGGGTGGSPNASAPIDPTTGRIMGEPGSITNPIK